MTNKLEQKVQEIENKFPGIAEKVKPYKDATWGIHWNSSIEDIDYVETIDYQVAAARWHQHKWSEGGGGVEWTDWISIYHKKKKNAEISELKTEKIVTRHRYDPKLDKTFLWDNNRVGIKHVQGNIIRTAWISKEGYECPLLYYVDLDTKEVTRLKLPEFATRK